jgi:hypothetical protein
MHTITPTSAKPLRRSNAAGSSQLRPSASSPSCAHPARESPADPRLTAAIAGNPRTDARRP